MEPSYSNLGTASTLGETSDSPMMYNQQAKLVIPGFQLKPECMKNFGQHQKDLMGQEVNQKGLSAFDVDDWGVCETPRLRESKPRRNEQHAAMRRREESDSDDDMYKF